MCAVDGICSVCDGRGRIVQLSGPRAGQERSCWRCGGTGRWVKRNYGKEVR